MSSKNLIDGDVLNFYGGEPPVVNIDKSNLNEVRESLEGFMTTLMKPLERTDVDVTRTELASGVGVLVFKPSHSRGLKPAILHIHGGGFIACSVQPTIGHCQTLAHELDCVVISVDYRLAPEHPFPAGLNDCYEALKWVYHSAAKLEVDQSKIAITGESGGGGLAAQLALLARDRGEVPVLVQVLTYPMLDNRTGISVDPGRHAGEFLWTKISNRFAWNSYLPSNDDFQLSSPPYPSVPTRVEDLSGVAPAFIAVGDLDLFARENVLYAQKLIEAGVPVELHLYRGGVHGFDSALEAPIAKAFMRDRLSAFRKAFKI